MIFFMMRCEHMNNMTILLKSHGCINHEPLGSPNSKIRVEKGNPEPIRIVG
jgi:hypothetical protein